MIEILGFIFSDIWRFIGTGILLVIISRFRLISINNGLSYEDILKLVKKNNKKENKP